jgi:hypothetical protein
VRLRKPFLMGKSFWSPGDLQERRRAALIRRESSSPRGDRPPTSARAPAGRSGRP